MADILRISAKKLGRLAMPTFCPRCFWVQTHMLCDPPFSVFPRIFNDLDHYTKRYVHGYFDELLTAPPWLQALAKLTKYIVPPKSNLFQMPIGENILLTGEADAIFTRSDVRLVVADYKTAFANTDDPLLPVYRVQLNAYKLLAEYLNLGNVETLALIYAQPLTSDSSARLPENRREDGFALGFRCQVLDVPINTDEVIILAQKAWDIYSQTNAPNGSNGCPDCLAINELLRVVNLTMPSQTAYATLFKAS